jgi:hypothetical protein
VIEGAIRKVLLDHAGTSAIIGTKIYLGQALQGTLFPYITYNRISTAGRDLHHSSNAKLAQPRFQISCWGRDTTEAKELAVQVRKCLNNYRGSVTYGAITETINWIRIANEVDLFDQALGFQVAVDIIVSHVES